MFHVNKCGQTDPVVIEKTFLAAAKWCVHHAERTGHGQFDILRVEKRGRQITTEHEACFEIDGWDLL